MLCLAQAHALGRPLAERTKRELASSSCVARRRVTLEVESNATLQTSAEHARPGGRCGGHRHARVPSNSNQSHSEMACPNQIRGKRYAPLTVVAAPG